MGKRFFLLAMLALLGTSGAMATTFTVTNTNDAGSGSLRKAITDANADNSTPHTINITATGIISLQSALPALNRNMTINGPGALNLEITRGVSAEFSIFRINGEITATINDVTITNGLGTNIGPGPKTAGGGILNNGTLTINRCAIDGNTADDGCGIWSDWELTINNSTISNNTTDQPSARGGGIYVEGTATINNSTISGNTLGSVSKGGGIYADGAVTLTNVTITGNYATVGGGLYDGTPNEGEVTLHNTIIDDNTSNGSAPDAGGDFTSLGNNLIGDTDNNSGWVGSDIQDQDADLDPLFNNGGPTKTHGLQGGSPAIGGGNNDVLNPPYSFSTDQRGVSRLLGTNVDIGAFEFDDVPLPVELVDFTLSPTETSVHLAWRTASERDNAGFEVQRAVGENSSFTLVASYLNTPTLVGLGTSSSGKSYAFTDDELLPGTYRYRLVDVTAEGIRTEHEAKTVRVDGSTFTGALALKLDVVTPNPTTEKIAIGYTLPDAGAITIEIYSTDGRLISRPIHGAPRSAGANSETITISTLAPGNYTLRLVTANGSRVQGFVVVK